MENNKQGTFGIFSLSTMIIGIVIGSGIFMKNVSLISTNGSIGITLISWIVASILVFAIMISFIEIISITEKSGEQANLSNWGTKLVNEKFGKFMGLMMGFIWLPILICVLFSYSTSSIFDMFVAIGLFDVNNISKVGQLLIQILITISLLVSFCLLNAYFTKPGKIFQNVGTSIKTIPLFFAIFVFIIMFLTGDLHFSENQEWLNANSEINNDGMKGVWLMFLTIPPILFSLDGFLIAGLLSREAKDRTSYRWSLIIGLTFIVVIYILFSMATFGLGNPELGGFGSMPNLIISVFGTGALSHSILITITMIIVISMLTAASGCTLAASRIIADMSANNIIEDKNARLVKMNKHGAPTYAGYWVMIISLIWYSIFTLSDSILYLWGPENASRVSGTDFISNVSVVFAFIIYTFVIGAALVNRFTNKTEVDKNIAFIPSAIIAIALCSVVVLISGFYSILLPLLEVFARDTSSTERIKSIIDLMLVIAFVTIIIVSSVLLEYSSRRVTEETKERKLVIINEYYKEK